MNTDFEFDGRYARDFGLIIASLNEKEDVVTLGSELNFNSVPIRNGTLHCTTTATYDSVLETTFQVFKYDCKTGMMPLGIEEHREIHRWLNRKEPHIFKLIGDEVYDYVYFEGSFQNISKIEIAGKIYGYELHFVSNRPFALGIPVKFMINADTTNYEYRFQDISDEVGYIYPKMKITCNEATTNDDPLKINNSIENRETVIANCTVGETIEFDEFLNIIAPEHPNIQNDFNYEFFRIANSYEDRLNIITISHPCTIEIEYTPIVKGVGL